MGEYESYSKRIPSKTREQKIHPIWRGIGFLFMVLIPILSFLASGVILEQNKVNHWHRVPVDLYVRQGDFLSFTGDPLILIKLLIAFCLACVLFALLSFFAFAINAMFGKSRYGTYDLPPLSLPRGVHKSKAR